MKTIVLSVFVLFGYMGMGQVDLNDYKYIIVPKRLEGFKKDNEHGTSTLVKFLFDQKGFSPIYDDELPDELIQNRCLGLVASLDNRSGMFSTKTAIKLMDCRGDVVFTTREGKSRIKEYRGSYSEAINEAMASFDNIDYKYEAKEKEGETITLNFKNDVKKLEEKAPEAVQQKAEDTMAQNKMKESESEEAVVKTPKNTNPVVEQRATETEQYYKDNTPVASDIKKADDDPVKKLKIVKPDSNDIWYAQKRANGFQLVDSSPKIRMKLLKSSMDNIYMAQTDNATGVVFQKEGKWVYEYYKEDKLIQEELNIKF
ncbi:hypothetical protein [Maribacter sp. 2210JD10-5]|uniref:hypothetical protein n=1 Tax=Maribacter sp. 2210JD10-5 TaxID=3386272 RepID=UPI0039BCFD21